MKKLYTLLLIAVGSFAFGQTFYSENMGTPTATTLITDYVNGTAPATFQNGAPIVYSGTGDVRTSLPSTGYSGASGNGNVFLTGTAGKYFQIDGLNTSAYSTADLQLSFGYLTNSAATQLVVEKSTDNGTTWTPISFPNNANTSWNLVTIGGSQIPSATSLSLRFTQPATAQMRIDDVKLSNVSASCTFAFGTEVATCDAITSSLDTYSITVPYTGGGNATYSVVVSAGTISGDNPTTVADGNILVTGVTEGTNVTITITGGTCNTSKEITSPSCKPINALPYTEHFEYTAGESLGAQQMWANVNSGDPITITPGNLSYTGVAAFGNSAAFSGAGIDTTTPFTTVTSGTIYASFLFNVTDYSNVTVDGAETYFAALTEPNAGAFRARLFIKKSGTQYQLGFANAGSTTTNYSPSLFNVGDVVMVVMGYDFATNTLKAWLNPTVATLTESTTPTLTEQPVTAITQLGAFLLRQDSATATPSITVDALRIATTINELLGVAQNDIAGLRVYPNPVNNGLLYIATNSNDTKAVAIFDVLGKKVIDTTVNEQAVNVSALTSGVYIVKITEAGKTATRKLVIK
jgi:hypothetical protein